MAAVKYRWETFAVIPGGILRVISVVKVRFLSLMGPQLGTTVLLMLNSQSYSLISSSVAEAGRLCFSGISPDEIGLKKRKRKEGRRERRKEGGNKPEVDTMISQFPFLVTVLHGL